MGLFGDKSAFDIFSDVKKQVIDKTKESSETMKKAKEAINESKLPIEGALRRYGVVYLGGLSQYPKKRSGEIGLNIMPECFYFKPTIGTDDWFEDMIIPYDKITNFEIKTRQITTTEFMLGPDSAVALKTENNIEITYFNNSNEEVVLRLEMLTGFTVYNQAMRCKEMVDFLRQQGILQKIIKQQPPSPPKSNDNVLELIEKLSQLRDNGIITEEEFNTKKAEFLAKL